MAGDAPPVSVTVAPLPDAAGVIEPDAVNPAVENVDGAAGGAGDVAEFAAASAETTR